MKLKRRTPIGLAVMLTLLLGVQTQNAWLVRAVYVGLTMMACLELGHIFEGEKRQKYVDVSWKNLGRWIRMSDTSMNCWKELVVVLVMLTGGLVSAMILPDVLLVVILFMACAADSAAYAFDTMIAESVAVTTGVEKPGSESLKEALAIRETDKSKLGRASATMLTLFITMILIFLMGVRTDVGALFPETAATGLALATFCMAERIVEVSDAAVWALLKLQGLSGTGVPLVSSTWVGPLEAYLIQHRTGGCLQIVDSAAALLTVVGMVYVLGVFVFH